MIASFVTSHGFGHLNRTAAVLNRVPASVPVAIFCKPDLFEHWRERLVRPASFVPHVCDSGAYNPPGDSRTTDGPATIAAALAARRDALARFDRDVELLRSHNPDVVLSDAASLPLVYARRLGVPGYLLANFTWADVYRPHAERLGPEAEAEALMTGLREEYGAATAILRTEPAVAMRRYGVPVVDVGLVATIGRPRAAELRAIFDIPPGDTVVYSYLGRYGQSDMGWDRVAALGGRGVRFVGFHPAPVPTPNVHVVDPREWTGADLASSSDVMAAKAGYGTACEAIVHRRPMIYPPRTGFVEHRALDRALRAARVGLPISGRAFDEMKIEPLLDRAKTMRPGPSPFAVDGADRVASILLRALRPRLARRTTELREPGGDTVEIQRGSA